MGPESGRILESRPMNAAAADYHFYSLAFVNFACSRRHPRHPAGPRKPSDGKSGG